MRWEGELAKHGRTESARPPLPTKSVRWLQIHKSFEASELRTAKQIQMLNQHKNLTWPVRRPQ